MYTNNLNGDDMKMIMASNGHKKIKVSKNEWQSIGKKAGWMPTESSNEQDVSIWELLNDWNEEGYGIALISSDNKVIDPYIDASDYPNMTLDESENGATVTSEDHKGCFVIFHSGSLEDLVGQDYLPSNENDNLV